MDLVERLRILTAVPWRAYFCEAGSQWLYWTTITGFCAMVVVTAYHGVYLGEDTVPIHELGKALGAAGLFVLCFQALNVTFTGVGSLRRQWGRRKAFMTMTPVIRPDWQSIDTTPDKD